MTFDVESTFNFFPIPTDLHFGTGVVSKVPDQVRSLGGRRVLVVTDPGVRSTGIIDRVERLLADGGLELSVYDRVKADSGAELITEATEQLRDSGCDVVVGIGGGSSLDTAKAVAVLATSGGNILDYVGIGNVKTKPLPVIAVPTTAGTGSEVTLWSVFTNESTRLKVAIGSLLVYPSVALCDPELTLGLPPFVTAMTGMDALTHAIECYTNNACQPISGALALQAIELIGQHLRRAVQDGSDRRARSAMLLASTMAAMAMNSTRLGLVHALAMPLGSWNLRVPHGAANAVTLPVVMRFNCTARPEQFANVARALGEPIHKWSVEDAAAEAPDAVERLARDIGIPRGLRYFGVGEEHVPKVVEEAMKSGNVIVNPRPATDEDLSRILREAL
jgi:alcohol dehydrogenase class IV